MKAPISAMLLSLGLVVACGDDAETSASETTTTTTTGTASSASPTGDLPTGDPTTGGTGETTGGSTGDEGSTGEPADPWQAFLDGREDYLRALAEPLLACIADVDSDYPVFSGCYDWPHAVQASYALHVVSRLTGDPSYLAAAEAKFSADGLAAEVMEIEEDELIYKEMPFGHGWLLTLAIERERIGKTDLRPLAEAVVAEMLFWYDTYYDQALLQSDVLKGDDNNITWMWFTLWQWAKWTDDAELAGTMEELVGTWLRDSNFAFDCPWSEENDNLYDPLPACLFGTQVILTMLPADATSWLELWLPDTPSLLPASDLETAYAQLNFARSWGLWKIREVDDIPRHRDLFLDHFNAAFAEQPSWVGWRTPQAGIHAIALTYPD